MLKVTRKIELTPVPAAPDTVAGIANMRGKVVTLLNTPVLFTKGGEQNRERVPRAVNAVIFRVSEDSGGQMGLVFDKAGTLVELDADKAVSLSEEKENGKGHPYFEAVDAGGEIYRLININSIMERFRDGAETYAGSQPREDTIDDKNA